MFCFEVKIRAQEKRNEEFRNSLPETYNVKGNNVPKELARNKSNPIILTNISQNPKILPSVIGFHKKYNLKP